MTISMTDLKNLNDDELQKKRELELSLAERARKDLADNEIVVEHIIHQQPTAACSSQKEVA